MLEDLPSNTHFIVCITAHLQDQPGARSCIDEHTLEAEPEEQEGSSALRIALGSLLAVFLVLLIVGLVVGGIVLWRRKKKRFPSPISKSTHSLNSATPMVGYQSKRFSKPKPYSISRSMNSVNSLDLDRDLEGFTPEERNRILRILSRSNASLASLDTLNDRYSRGSHPPQVPGAYGQHIPPTDGDQYDEIPVDQYQYIDITEINPNLRRQSKPPSVKERPPRPESYV